MSGPVTQGHLELIGHVKRLPPHQRRTDLELTISPSMEAEILGASPRGSGARRIIEYFGIPTTVSKHTPDPPGWILLPREG